MRRIWRRPNTKLLLAMAAAYGRSRSGKPAIAWDPAPFFTAPDKLAGAGGGAPGGALEPWSVTAEANNEPKVAMPVAIPTCRKVELMPEAMPDRAGSTTPTAVEANGGLTSPVPTPAMNRPGMRAV